jgi:hypothetical protein
MPRSCQTHPELVPVPIPDLVEHMIGDCMPVPVLHAEMAAEDAAREIRRFRPLESDDDRADRERELSRLHRANKTLAAYNPGLIVKAGGR